MEQCSEQEVEQLLKSVVPQRCNEVLQVRSLSLRFGKLKSFQMLQQLLPDLDWNDVSFQCMEYGKPYLCDGHGVRIDGVHFNLSHCSAGILVAVADYPIGVDIESFRNPSQALLQRCMNDKECQRIEQSETPEQTFAELWTRKEAVGKCRGTGLTDDMIHFLNGSEQLETHCNVSKGYAYSFAWKGQGV